MKRQILSISDMLMARASLQNNNIGKNVWEKGGQFIGSENVALSRAANDRF